MVYSQFGKKVVFLDCVSKQEIGSFPCEMESFSFLDNHRCVLLSKDISVLSNEVDPELEITYPTPPDNLATKFQLDFFELDMPEKTHESIRGWKKSKRVDNHTKTSGLVSDCSFLLKELYLLNRTQEAKKEVDNLLTAARDYLFGSWQETLPYGDKGASKELWHANLPWYDIIRSVLAWGTAAGLWKEVIEILQFIDDSCELEDGGKEELEYYQALRYHFNGNIAERDQLITHLIESRNKKYRQMAETVQTIITGDKKKAEKSWTTTAKLWLQKEGKRDWFLAPEATFLYYLAQKANIDIPLSAPWTDHVVKLPEE